LDAQPSQAIALTSITVAEILFGIERLPKGKRRSAFAQAAANLFDHEFRGRTLPFDAEAAQHYATEVAAAERRGRNVSMADAQIAAICARNKATLATRNTRDFEHFPIPLINPWHE